MLEELLTTKDFGGEAGEDEFMSLSQEEQDDIVNTMIARNQQEIALYESLDQQRELQVSVI